MKFILELIRLNMPATYAVNPMIYGIRYQASWLNLYKQEII